MTEKREVIRRLRHGQSIRQVHKETKMHRTIIRQLHQIATEQGWLDPGTILPDEAFIQDLLHELKGKPENSTHPLDPYRDQIQKWFEMNYSYLIIHTLLSEQIQVSEATVRRYCKKHCAPAPKAKQVRTTVAGHIMEVDFGYLGLTYDPIEQRSRKTWVFSARLSHSRYAYRECVLNQKQETFFLCHIHAFSFFQGVPEKVVPDNLKAAVLQASFTDPVINRIYLKLAEHYDFLIDPCPPYTPELKGGVESDIKYIKRNFWPRYCERQRSLGHEVPHRDDLQKSIEHWAATTAHVRVLSGVGKRPVDLFTQEEQPALRILPTTTWKIISWVQVKVQETWRIQVDKAWYTVPYQYIGKQVLVYKTLDEIHIYFEYKVIAVHQRSTRQWQTVYNPAHEPPNIQHFTRSTREGLLRQAKEISHYAEKVVQEILSRKSHDGFRPARAIIGLAKKYSPQAVEFACKRALEFDNVQYATIKSILMQPVQQLPPHPQEGIPQQSAFTFARGEQYYQNKLVVNNYGGQP